MKNDYHVGTIPEERDHLCHVDHSQATIKLSNVKRDESHDHQDRILVELQEWESLLDAFEQPLDKHNVISRQAFTSFFSFIESFENLNPFRFFTNHRKK